MIIGSHFTDEKSEAQAADMTSKCQDMNPCLSSLQALLSHPLPQVSRCDLLRAHRSQKCQGGTCADRRLPFGVIQNKSHPFSKCPLCKVNP